MAQKTDSRFIDFGTTGNKVNSQNLPANFSPTNYSPVDSGEGLDKTSSHLRGIDALLIPPEELISVTNEVTEVTTSTLVIRATSTIRVELNGVRKYQTVDWTLDTNKVIFTKSIVGTSDFPTYVNIILLKY